MEEILPEKILEAKEKTNQSSRLIYIDNLRALMIISVVLVHVGVTYTGLGSWFYIEKNNIGMLSKIVLAVFMAFSQAYFMSILFLFAGHFTPNSLKRKDKKRFVFDRFIKLGIPTIFFIFLLNPICVKLSYPETNIKEFYLNGIKSLDFLSWTGPLWFTLLLFILSLLYLIFNKQIDKINISQNFKITKLKVIFLIIIITILAFLIRLVFPINTSFYNMQFSFFSAYLIFFFIGLLTSKINLFEKISYQTGKKYLLLSIFIGLPLWLLIIIFGGPLKGVFLIHGGLNWQSFIYAFWESFFCVTFIIALVGISKQKLNSQNTFQRFISDNAFGVYVFHAPILIFSSLLFKNISMQVLLKFIFVSLLALCFCFVLVFLFRQFGFIRKILG